MTSSIAAKATASKGNLDVLADRGQDKNLVLAAAGEGMDLVLRLLRESIDESGWKNGAVAEAIGLKGESGAAYFSKMLGGEKPIGAKHLRSLPDDIEAIFARKYAESFGLIVVVPAVGSDAIRQLIAGLVGVLQTQLPARASAPLKAALATKPDSTRRLA